MFRSCFLKFRGAKRGKTVELILEHLFQLSATCYVTRDFLSGAVNKRKVEEAHKITRTVRMRALRYLVYSPAANVYERDREPHAQPPARCKHEIASLL